jgi:tetratricopeptide (TPR) repeat protein
VWKRVIPYADPSTAPAIQEAEAAGAFDAGWYRLESAQGGDSRQLLEAAQSFHRGLRWLQRAPWVWLGLAEVAVQLSYDHGDEYDNEGIDWAIGLLDRALAIEPGNVDAGALKADALMLAGRFKEGAAALRGLPTNHWRVCTATGRLCAVTGNTIVRRTAWRSAFANAPPRRKAGIANSLAAELFDLGRVDEAIDTMRDAIALKPEHAWAHYNLAMMLSRIGRGEEAMASVRRALAIFDFPAARSLEQRLSEGPPKGRKAPAMLTLCAACGSPAGEGACACGASEGTVLLSEVEVAIFRKKPCATCKQELLGFATRCAQCRTVVA